jgi:hypothetical protein
MTTKSELMQAHEAMASVLDAKLANMPEWKAFRAIGRALQAEGGKARAPEAIPTRARSILKVRDVPSYTMLTERALQERGRPIVTPDLMDFIGRHRNLSNDSEKAKVNVTSSLSKSDRFRSVPWEGGKAWWYADKPIPKKETAA